MPPTGVVMTGIPYAHASNIPIGKPSPQLGRQYIEASWNVLSFSEPDIQPKYSICESGIFNFFCNSFALFISPLPAKIIFQSLYCLQINENASSNRLYPFLSFKVPAKSIWFFLWEKSLFTIGHGLYNTVILKLLLGKAWFIHLSHCGDKTINRSEYEKSLFVAFAYLSSNKCFSVAGWKWIIIFYVEVWLVV